VWMIKGLFFGLFSFVLFTILYFTYWNWPLQSNRATGFSVIQGLFLHRPLYWIVSGSIVIVACMIARLLHTVR
jgi:hypothetical protein